MVHFFLAAPFADAARAVQFAAVRAALAADSGTDSLLLGNLVLEDEAAPLDAVVVRPHGITLLVLVPRGGVLSIPALGYGSWQLGGVPLAGSEDFDNPFEQFRQQKVALVAWLRPRFTPAQANLQFIGGVVVFEAPLTFGPDVEAALNEAPAGFQLLAGPADLSRRLRQLATPEIDLTAADLAEWAAELNDFAATAPAAPADASHSTATPETAADAIVGSFLGGKARALWGWLGANDVPDDDVPYGAAAALTARNEEKQHLEQLRQQMQADVQAQLQALETRENERERSIAQLRAELAQAPPVAAEATALVSRLGAETREKAALEAEMEASRAELAARNQELDAKIQQLSQLIGQLSAAPASAPAMPAQQAALPASAPEPTAARSMPALEEPPTSALPVPPVQAAAPAAAPVGAAEMPAVAPTEAYAPSAAPPPQNAIAKAAPVVEASEAATVALAAPAAEREGTPPAAPAAALASRPEASAVTSPVAEIPPAAAGSPVAVPVTEYLRAFGARAQMAVVPRLRRLGEQARARPRVLLGAAGGVALVVALWALAHRGTTAPVPYQENGRWGYADASGAPVIKAQFASAAPFAGGQAVVEKDGAFGLVDEAGKEVVAPAYDAINPYHGGYARVRVGEAYTFLEEGGQEFDHYFFNAQDFAEGRAAVLDHRGWFYLSGPEVPENPLIFREAYSFVDGLARVRLLDGYTFITPEYLANPASGTKPFGRYQLAADFLHGQARVSQNGRSFLIDKDGEEVK